MPANSGSLLLTVAMKMLEIALRAIAENREPTAEEIAAELDRVDSAVNIPWHEILRKAGILAEPEKEQ